VRGRLSRGVGLWVVVCLLMLVRPAGALDVPQLAEKATPSVVQLTIKNAVGDSTSTGSGFFISTDGRIVTNHHVIAGASSVIATMHDGKELKISGVLVESKSSDLAVIKADGGPFVPLKLGRDGSLRIGDEVVVIGNPRGLSTTVSAGIVSAIRDDGLPIPGHDSSDSPTGSWGIQVSAPISPGSSGSPILNKEGEVVAVAVGTYRLGESLNFGVPVQLLRAQLVLADRAALRPFATDTDHSVLRNLGISAAFFAALGIAFWISGRFKGRVREQRKKPHRHDLS